MFFLEFVGQPASPREKSTLDSEASRRTLRSSDLSAHRDRWAM